MNYTLKYNKERDLILGSIKGEFDSSLVKAMVADLEIIIQEQGCRKFLNDLRQAKITSSILEIYTMPKKIAEFKEAKNCKRAILVSGSQDDYKFLETVSK